MKLKNGFFVMLAAMLILGVCVSRPSAQPAENTIAHKDVFGKLKRPPAVFSHDLHMGVFEDQGCGVCHHVLDENAGELVYRQGEEYACPDCHGKSAKDGAPALREAYHGSCTACHRSMVNNNMNSGPTTCGQCHPKLVQGHKEQK
jgi:hypothetical protein